MSSKEGELSSLVEELNGKNVLIDELNEQLMSLKNSLEESAIT